MHEYDYTIAGIILASMSKPEKDALALMRGAGAVLLINHTNKTAGVWAGSIRKVDLFAAMSLYTSELVEFVKNEKGVDYFRLSPAGEILLSVEKTSPPYQGKC